MSGRRVEVHPPAWWPPKPGDKVRKIENGTEYLCHVTAVFEWEDGNTFFVVAWYGKHKQWWHYDVVTAFQCELGMYWPDGTERPQRR